MNFPALTLTELEFNCSRGARSRATWCDLHEELQACQRRLGTPEERADDFSRARELAHEINNRLTIAYLETHLRAEAQAAGQHSWPLVA